MSFYLHLSPRSRDAMQSQHVCLSVCPSVTRRYSDSSVEVARVAYHQIFSPSGSHTILAFPYNTALQYSDRHPLTAVSNGKQVVTLLSQRGRAMLRVCQHLAPAVL